MVGGGPVRLGGAQQLRRLGAAVTLVESSRTILEREKPGLGHLLARSLRDDGVDLRLGVHAEAARPVGDACELRVGGDAIRVERVVVAIGRRPAIEGIGLESVGVDAASGALTAPRPVHLSEPTQPD